MRTERLEFTPRRSTRSYSVSSEVPSLPGYALLSPPSSINPEPAYIAVSAASQLVTAELETDGVTISASALAQLNSFLDNVLFNILLAAKSAKLSLLRPAIYNVLKPKLGKAAISGADEELREYLGDDEDEDESLETNLDREARHEFDLELAWKLARLRCMVYSRLGDLEEDDEDEYIEREDLDERGGKPRRFSSHPSRVTTAAAIFLTSIIEFLAEQALAHAAQATQRKLSRSRSSQSNLDAAASLPSADRIEVSEADMRHLGRDSPLQKLWRGWRHQVRMPTDPASRPISPDSHMIPGHSRKPSMNPSGDIPESEEQHQPPVPGVIHESDPACIPLPITDNDIDEIEVPGLSSAHDNDHIVDTDRSPGRDRLRRLRSLERFPSQVTPLTLTSLDDRTGSPEAALNRPTMQHRRSRSLPTSPILTSCATTLGIAAHKSNAAEPSREVNQAQDDKVVPHSGPAIPQQPSVTSSSSATGHSEPGTLPTAVGVMPGTFPTGKIPSVTQIVKKGNVSRDLDAMLPISTATSATEPDVNRDGTPTTPIARNTHNATTLEPALPFKAHPLRISSKPLDDSPPPSEQNSFPQLANSTPTSKAASGYFGAPPLAPLQEVLGEAQEIPEQRTPSTPITEAQKRQGQIMFPFESRDVRSRTSSKSSHHTNHSSSSSKLLGFDREQLQSGPDRAGVQRIYPVPPVQDLNGHITRPSTSQSAKERRPGTASSHMSLKQGSLGRASLDTTLSHSRGLKQSMEQDAKKESLESLIRSEETLKFTLTPQSMRQMEAPGSPRQKTQTQELADFFRDTAPPGHISPVEVVNKPRSPAAGINGLRANPPRSVAVSAVSYPPVESPRPSRMQQQAPTSPGAKSVRSQYQPRDPKIEKPSTGDLADFAKSTGPEDPGQLPKAVARVPAQTRRANSTATRFQARDPIVKGASSDLIDFIREGPPRANGDGTHRIPRTVAPFRTTMDSDELNALEPPQDLARRGSGSSNQDGSIVTKSTVNSRTGLIDSTNRKPLNSANTSNLASSQVSKNYAIEAAQPKRKQRRVRDPYAIDMGSDDEIDDGLGKPPKYEEESLMDFLRNSSPPPESKQQPQPLILSANYMAAQPQRTPKKPAQGGFRERLKRTASTNSLSRHGGAKSSPASSDRPPTLNRTGSQIRPLSPHLVQSGSRFDSYKPTQTTYAAHVERNRQKEPTQGLDDGRDEGSLSRFFSRRRRVAA